MPTLWSGWYGDDSLYSNLNGTLAADQTTVWSAMARAFWLWFQTKGRFDPGFVFEKYIEFHLFTSVVAYKILLVAATVASLEAFRRCIAAYADVRFANLAALLVPLMFQERGYHDSLLAYNAMPQTIALFVLGSLLLFRSALLHDDTKHMLVAVGLFLLAALMYEDAYAFCLLYPLAAHATGKRFRDALRLASPFFAVAAAFVALDLALRARVHLAPNDWYASNLVPGPVIKTVALQIVAAVPLSYWFVDPLVIFRLQPSYFVGTPGTLPPAIVFLIFSFAAWFAVQRALPNRNMRGWIWCGVLTLVVPALPIAILVKYQEELRLGLGYLPVFFEAFGLALILAALISRACAPQYRLARFGIVFAIAVFGTLTQTANARLASELQPSREARASLERELAEGLFDRFPDCRFVATKKYFDWMAWDDQGPDGITTRGMLYAFGKHRAILVSPNDPRATCRLSYNAGSNTWELLQAR